MKQYILETGEAAAYLENVILSPAMARRAGNQVTVDAAGERVLRGLTPADDGYIDKDGILWVLGQACAPVPIRKYRWRARVGGATLKWLLENVPATHVSIPDDHESTDSKRVVVLRPGFEKVGGITVQEVGLDPGKEILVKIDNLVCSQFVARRHTGRRELAGATKWLPKIKVTPAIDASVREAARSMGLSKADAVRHLIQLGLDHS